ncbi:cobyric acid synthase [Pseudovibrio brasiliensis]|uniref:Cobyric acid synthase n=1 Tax=Pseudovibrio brasiliensis TaxID=1898042 RepID=A0ABX8AGZ2_9HYPH|nr:cobyric acid synthase [Pseudovibrio brasiliensis]QUS54188.1 cobyric acid synthase [Pseudovibrio brasiliensis]
MIQGTGSNVGKSVLVAGLARAFTRRGLSVQPFKPQNMSNNAAVTADGGEIGRAQALQARGAKVATSVHMNPVLLKPESDSGSQVIVQGKRFGTLLGAEFGRQKGTLIQYVMESFAEVESKADLVLVEGAGSPAEINLRSGDIANMGFAEAADIPVVLCGDIDRGGVIASLVGTHAVLEPDEAKRIKSFLINKFRGEPSLFDSGVTAIEDKTGWPCNGVVPWFPQVMDLPAEDALDLSENTSRGKLKVVVPVISRIANFDDLDPLRMEADVSLEFVLPGEVLPADADVVLLPGTKSTIGDLAFFRAQGWDIDLYAHVRRGGQVLGICGGYQMLGKTIADPEGIEGEAGSVNGLGLLDVETVLTPHKETTEKTGRHIPSGESVTGYEIHVGRTDGPDCERPFVDLGDHVDGAVSKDGLISGCYMHGIFGSDAFRSAFLKGFGATSQLGYEHRVEQALDALADHLEEHLDLDALWEIAQSRV